MLPVQAASPKDTGDTKTGLQDHLSVLHNSLDLTPQLLCLCFPGCTLCLQLIQLQAASHPSVAGGLLSKWPAPVDWHIPLRLKCHTHSHLPATGKRCNNFAQQHNAAGHHEKLHLALLQQYHGAQLKGPMCYSWAGTPNVNGSLLAMSLELLKTY